MSIFSRPSPPLCRAPAAAEEPESGAVAPNALMAALKSRRHHLPKSWTAPPAPPRMLSSSAQPRPQTPVPGSVAAAPLPRRPLAGGRSRKEHWKLLGNLKTTVEGLVSISNPNVWSKYGGLERLCRDMHSILYHGLIHDKVCCRQKDYWQFVKDIRWLSPSSAHHLEKFISLQESDQRDPEGPGDQAIAQLWLQHSLQCHCLSAQLRPLLGNRQYIRKFYADTAFLLSDAHVTAMLQCLEAVEQNNPRLLAQIDTSMLAGTSLPSLCTSDPSAETREMCDHNAEGHESHLPGALGCLDHFTESMLTRRSDSLSPVTKSQSLTALPGSPYVPAAGCTQQRCFGSSSSLHHPASSGLSDRRPASSFVSSNSSQPQEHCLSTRSSSFSEGRSTLEQPGSVTQTSSPKDPFSPASEMSSSTTSQSEDTWTGSQDDPQSDVNDGPEYLAIGNLGRRGRACSSTSTNSSKSSSSKLFSSSSSQKLDSVSSLGEQGASGGGSRGLSLLRRSSFSEGQSSAPQGILKKSHVRSHSDTNVTSGKLHESHGDPAGGRGPVSASTQSSELSTPSSLYMEYDSGQYLSSGEGMFRRPSEGQSLISYLSEQDFGSCADLEKENAHFSISESLIAAIELMKCNMMSRQLEEEEEEDSDKEIQELKQKIRIRRQQIRTSRFPACQEMGSDSLVATDSGSQFSSHGSMRLSDSGSAEDVEEYEIRDGNDGSNLIQMSKNGLSVSMASLFSDADIKRNPDSRKSFLSSDSISHSFLNSNSAEAVAMGLLKQFEGMQLPAASELEWLVPEHDAPQKLLPIPDSLPISPDDGEHADIYKLRIRVRGNLEWAPPRPQIIFNVHPAPTRKVAVAKQNYRCAGCGIRTDPDYIKRLRYCEYLGKYFCQCCHENAQMVIPSRILRKWDFSKYYVSNFSKDLLSKIWSDPLFNVQDINPALYRKVKALNQVWLLRIQLFHMKNMFKTCRLAKDLLDSFDTVPGHLTEDLHLYSLSDLSATKKGDLVPRLTELLKAGSLHVDKCMLCQAKGFICEFCQNEDDIIFPFELNKCRTCEECKACYHKSCFKSTHCPRCERLQARRELMAKQSMESYISDYEDELEQPEAVTAT
ncbi:run domain Beclin-1-interacting and cysteine-rich domain-containing protein isoform X2 [Neopelma chrysocephalum]|uniref:run domain Beclin-1-interacting and cysteine-rich domain-containing protein isoform X2 n=1 Tax=Neopelma chrysocephalum TaxID=114329 RepID=UPI000FCCE82F|nr:run domain Beclin-1-interacting and cysteine-rich domain-containing protein isoform X2 [Neopelma chrysocephalum]